MSLIFRMLILLMASLFKPKLPILKTQNRLQLHVLPNDLDINFHMNNGRYLTVCDLSRVDMFLRTGLAKTMLKRKWMPVISEHTMKYKKGLKLWQKYELTMQVTHWDERSFYMQHQFILGDRIVAEGTSLGVIVGKEGVVPPEQVMKACAELTGEKLEL